MAAAIFNITLHLSATHKGSNGHFTSGGLQGAAVNIKWYPKHESLIDLNLKYFPDYYLVLTGPKSPAISSRSATRPWLIEYIFLFETQALFDALKLRKISIGVATSVITEIWLGGEIYPIQRNNKLILTDEQHKQLTLFKRKST